MFDIIGWLPICASSISIISVMPQISKMRQTKSAKDISWLFLCLQFLADIIWLVYGAHFSLLPVLIGSSLFLCALTACLITKCYYDFLYPYPKLYLIKSQRFPN